MIAALAALSGLLLLGYGMLRTLRAGRRTLAHDRQTVLRIALPPRKDRPVLTLLRGAEVLFGPVLAQWTAADSTATACGNGGRDPTLPGGDVPAGRYRVLEAADISDAAEPIRLKLGSFGADFTAREWGPRHPAARHAAQWAGFGRRGGAESLPGKAHSADRGPAGVAGADRAP